MNSDKIKWCVERAEGFGIEESRGIFFLSAPDGVTYNLKFLDTQPKEFTNSVIAHLLTRIIEGINREGNYHINIDYKADKKYYSETYRRDDPFDGETKVHDTPDEAKTAAIDFVYEQEQGK